MKSKREMNQTFGKRQSLEMLELGASAASAWLW